MKLIKNEKGTPRVFVKTGKKFDSCEKQGVEVVEYKALHPFKKKDSCLIAEYYYAMRKVK